MVALTITRKAIRPRLMMIVGCYCVIGAGAECRHSGALGQRYVQLWIPRYQTVFSDTNAVPDDFANIKHNRTNGPDGAKRGHQNDADA